MKRDMSFQTREMPAGFAEDACQSLHVLRKKYATSYEYVAHWRRQLGVTTAMLRAARSERERESGVRKKTRIATPADLASFQRGRTVTECAKHYGVAYETMARMLKSIGIDKDQERRDAIAAKAKAAADAKAAREAAKAERAKAASTPKIQPAAQHRHNAFAQPAAPSRPQHYDTRAGQAAAYLQGQGYIPVFRSDAQGCEPKASGKFWRCGRRILNDAEIIDLADSVRERRARKMAA